MKTTLDLPPDLVKQMKLRAVHEGKKLKYAVAELLRRGLASPRAGTATAVKADKAMLKRRDIQKLAPYHMSTLRTA